MIKTISKRLALGELRDMVAADSHPTLDTVQLERLLYDVARRPDGDRRNPNDEAWDATYDLAAAAAEGWRRKAAMVAGDYTFEADNSKLNRSDVIKHCLEMAKTYAVQVVPYPTRYATVRDRRTPSDEFEALIWSEALEI